MYDDLFETNGKLCEHFLQEGVCGTERKLEGCLQKEPKERTNIKCKLTQRTDSQNPQQYIYICTTAFKPDRLTSFISTGF